MSKTLRLNAVFTVVLVIVLLLVIAVVARMLETAKADSIKLEEAIKIEKSRNLSLTGTYQTSTLEDSIVPFASRELGMIKNTDTTKILTIK